MSIKLFNQYMYADDTIIYFSGSDNNEIMATLQNDLDRVAQWMTSSRLVLNYSKTKVMLFGTKQKTWSFRRLYHPTTKQTS